MYVAVYNKLGMTAIYMFVFFAVHYANAKYTFKTFAWYLYTAIYLATMSARTKTISFHRDTSKKQQNPCSIQELFYWQSLNSSTQYQADKECKRKQ